MPGRRVNPCFGAAETMWILRGSEAPWIFDYNAALLKFADGGILRGAYGPRLRNWGGAKDQLRWVLRVLKEDSSSRRAVIQIFDPGAVDIAHHDIPCTIGFRFFIRQGRLSMHTLMRANDVWLGMPYDVFCFTTIHEIMAFNLKCVLGDYVHIVDSIHLYDHDLERARGCHLPQEFASAQHTAHRPLRVSLDDLDAELDAATKGGAPPHGAFGEHGALLKLYGQVKQGLQPDAGLLNSLSPAFRESFALWSAP